MLVDTCCVSGNRSSRQPYGDVWGIHCVSLTVQQSCDHCLFGGLFVLLSKKGGGKNSSQRVSSQLPIFIFNYHHKMMYLIIRNWNPNFQCSAQYSNRRDYIPMTRRPSFHTSVSRLLQKISIMIHGLQNSFYRPEWVKFHRERRNSLIFVFTQRNQPSLTPRRSW